MTANNRILNSTRDAAQSNITAINASAIAAGQRMVQFLTNRVQLLELFLVIGYGIMFTLCVTLICYMRYNRSVAFRGDTNAARKIILPAFEPLLWILGVTTGIFTAYTSIALAFKVYTTDIPSIPTEIFYSGRQAVFLLVMVFMLQKSVSVPALQRTVIITFVLSTYTVPIVAYMAHRGSRWQLYFVNTITRALMLALYTYMFIRPPPRASKRTIREFCVYAYIYYAKLFLYKHLFYLKKLEWGFALTYANLLWGSLCPLVIWRVLKADTAYWRGMGQRACLLQSIFRQKNNISDRVSSQGLHVLIEMHRKFIIDFAYLELKRRIGIGATGVVFNGVLHSKIPVAIKVYTPSEYTENTVAEYSQEAALCGALRHPNIVKFYGMCVCPPTICLVSELCQGSLDDVTKAIARRKMPEQRCQFLINLGYIIDAARAVAYLHSFSPAFIHRDIKPANFLLDAECNVKLTDFGESRSLPRIPSSLNADIAAKSWTKECSSIDVFDAPNTIKSGNLEPMTQKTESVGLATIAMTVRGTVDYMAPEVINGKAGLATYGEAADVYSFAITMWDILAPEGEKYPKAKGNNHMKIFQLVVDGNRPALNFDMHSSLRSIMEKAWHPDPNMRPTAQNIIRVLESIQEEVLATFAMTFANKFEDCTGCPKGSMLSGRKCFTGHKGIEHLIDSGFVSSVGESIRLGNALMDAGIIHHAKHNQSFEYSDSKYFFHESNILLCQPLSAIKEHSSGEEDDRETRSHRVDSSKEFSQALSDRSNTSTYQSDLNWEFNGKCECRKLGQRLEHIKLSRRKFRRRLRAVYEENMLTTRLLGNDANDFEGFEMLHTPPCA